MHVVAERPLVHDLEPRRLVHASSGKIYYIKKSNNIAVFHVRTELNKTEEIEFERD